MRFLQNADAIREVIVRLIADCKSLRWALAWGSCNFAAFDLLLGNRRKIAKLTVGTYFCQTHPNFIKAFVDDQRVRFVLETAGVFHPKLYLFDHGPGKWDCVIGSPNFTRSAFSINDETAVLIDHNDRDAAAAKKEIEATLDHFFSLGSTFDAAMLETYSNSWKKRVPVRRKLARVKRSLRKLTARVRIEGTLSDALKNAAESPDCSKVQIFIYYLHHPQEPIADTIRRVRPNLITEVADSSIRTWISSWRKGHGLPRELGRRLGSTNPDPKPHQQDARKANQRLLATIIAQLADE